MAHKDASPWVLVGVGLLGAAIGAGIILASLGKLPVQGRLAPGVTNWIVICAGIGFASIGGVFALTGFSGTRIGNRLQKRLPLLFRLLNFSVAMAAFGSLTLIASYAAVGPGPREFSLSIPFLGRVAGAEILGRIFFGAIALLLWAVLLTFAWFGVRGVAGRE